MKFLYSLLALTLLLSGCGEFLSDASAGLDQLIAAIDAGIAVGPQRVALISKDRRAVDLVVEVADTPEEREQGLKGRKNLPEGFGMLFLFPEPAVLRFWMKDTLIPLDIVFMDGAGNVVSTVTMEPCPSGVLEGECPTYGSGWPARIALEIPAGTVAHHGIGPGWRLAIETSR